MASVCSRQGFQDLEAGLDLRRRGLRVRAEGQRTVKNHPKNLWLLVERQKGAVKVYLRMMVGLVRIGSEE